MAITAAVTLNDTTVQAAVLVAATLTVSNGNATAALVTGISPKVTPSGGTSRAVNVAVGPSPWGAAFPQSVAASGTQAFAFAVTPNSPTYGNGLAQPQSRAYSVGATVYFKDGSIVEATPETLTVTPMGH